MTTNRNTNRIEIYIPLEIKIELRKKASKMGLSFSKLLIESALNYEVPERSKLYLNNQFLPNKPVPVNQEALKQ